MNQWQPIETAPKDGTSVLLYWPRYSYETGPRGSGDPVMAIGSWKTNGRLEPRGWNDEAIKKQLAQLDASASYFSDNDEFDDYGLAQAHHAPTHWMPLPSPPEGSK